MLNHEPLRAQDDPFDIDVGEDEEEDGEDEDEDDGDEDEEGGWQVVGRATPAA